MSVGPFVAATFNGLSEEFFDKRTTIFGWEIFVPGVRVTLWLASLIIIGAGFLAFTSVRNIFNDNLENQPEEAQKVEAKFIAFEGGDASGKTTQAKRVSHKLNAVFTREPGGTPVGESLRSILLDPAEAVALRAEALLMAASRAQLVHDVIKPALSNGQHVVTDRFLSSSLAYQGYASGLPLCLLYTSPSPRD